MARPAPNPRVQACLGLLPNAPGVYLMRGRSGRVLYVGRSRNLRARVRSYWQPSRSGYHRPGLTRYVDWVEPVLTASEHEAAFLERYLLADGEPGTSRGGGQEVYVWIRLASPSGDPGLHVVHTSDLRRGDRAFGPYLGGRDARLAVAGLNRLYPISLTHPVTGAERDLARALAVGPRDRARFDMALEAVLARDPPAVSEVMTRLTQLRDDASARLRFEDAARIQKQLEAVAWICQPQRFAALDGPDLAVRASASAPGVAVEVVVKVAAGSFVDRLGRLTDDPAGSPAPGQDAHWDAIAMDNARLLASLAAAGAIGAGFGSLLRRPRGTGAAHPGTAVPTHS